MSVSQNKFTKSNVGRIRVTWGIISNNPSDVARLFSQMQFVPVKADNNLITNVIEYEGFSPLFDEILNGETTPDYNIEVLSEGGEVFSITVDRVESLERPYSVLREFKYAGTGRRLLEIK